MRYFLSLLLLVLVSLAQAISTTGNRLLVVIEEAAEKVKYSTLWKDLEGMSNYALTVLPIEIVVLTYSISRQGLQINVRVPQK